MGFIMMTITQTIFDAGFVLAQAQPQGSPLDLVIPLLFMIPIFYFLIIRPQNKRMKEQRQMVEAAKKGDVIVTSGGIVGKITKSKEGDSEVEVEIAKDVRVMIVRTTIADVRNKTEPANDTK